MTDFDWRDAESYRDVQTFDAAALAWEFLRRNPDYRMDYDRIASTNVSGPLVPNEFRRKWGLCFRC